MPDSPGPASSPAPRAAALRAAAAVRAALFAGAGPGLESHIIGVGASNTAPPAPWSTAVRPPCAVSWTATPSALIFSRSWASSWLAAALADFTTSSWVKPSTWAATRKSTSVRTSA
ncbi:hypothetical protein ACQEVX_08450 [Streptomyces syringium]|uniref:hypothetical protein n=1 Tax=Streptomyces syringium TaxID=76729 RepID=UPI003D8D6894